MVHALEESWRVLRPEGVLIDLRPIASNPLIEIMSDNAFKAAGHIDDSSCTADDLAADEALDHAVARGLFKPIEIAQFKFSLYWDSIESMQTYVEDSWSESQQIPSEVLMRAKELARKAGNPDKARIQRKLHLGAFDKISTEVELSRIIQHREDSAA